MTWCRSAYVWLRAGGIALLAVMVWTIGVRAELPEWVRNVDVMSRFHDAFFRTVPMPNGPVEVRRPPAETHEALARIAGAAADQEVLAKRARAAEEQLDPASAEADWKAYARGAPDAAAGQLALADFYHRRLMPQEEAAALAAAAQAPDAPGDRLAPPADRRSWRLFERLFALIAAQQLPDALAEAQYRAWIARYPGEAQPYDRLFRFLVAHDRTADAAALLILYQQAFPADEAWPLQARADLATHRGATADALAIYDQAFRPLWPADITRGYFDLLERNHGLRAFLDRARADIAASPDDIGPVARVFYYYQRAGNVGAAEQALADFEARRENGPRSADELLTLARLFEKTRNHNQALRYYSALYNLPGATAADVEQALASIIETLFAAPEQPLRFGSGDLSFYRDIATLDPYPGFLNGVLSLLFNSTSPRDQFAAGEAASGSYFHRGRAADLLALFDTRFPASPRRADLHATLVETYSAYGEADAVIDQGRRFLEAFPGSPRRTAVSLAMADAFARKDQVVEELAAYDRLLQELAARADRVPLGAAARAAEPSSRSTGARSQEYARVLDRCLARLVSLERLPDALAVYRREIDRNPDDPGLYAAAAQFLEQNDVTAEVEQIYRRAIQQFPDRSWHHRLARWYLRRNQAAAFESLTREVVRAFDGTELAAYFENVVGRGPGVSARLYLQLNLFAHERFPHHLPFVRNLLGAYADADTRDPAAFAALLQRHWFEDEGLSAQFFASLSRTGRLETELADIRRTNPAVSASNWASLAKDNPVAARFVAEADIWRSRFESATPVLNALAGEYPADVDLGRRVGSLQRSLSYDDVREVDAAAATGERLHRFDPRDPATLTALGEIHADRERYERARPHWDRIPDIEPGRAEGYLEAASIFWDYYQFDDALRLIALGRTRLGVPTLYAYESGAIHEGMRQPQPAIDEYVRGALAGGGDSPAQARLLTLARRPAYRDLADRATAAAAGEDAPPLTAVSLRIAVLDAQGRRPDLERFLQGVLDRTSSLELMIAIGGHADRLGFESIRTRALTRQIEVMTDPIDKLQLRYALVRLHESRGELDLARKALDLLYAENPRILGVVRQTVDYYWRHGARPEAIDALVRAASAAYPALTKQFTFEAARKATGLAEYARARDLLQPILAADPFNPEYLAAVADTYALAKDDAALRDFYRSTIEAMRNAPIAADERTRRIAGLRRGIIPALDRLNDRAGAVDQYIEIINRYPDDDALLQEAGRYARQHAQADRLVAYYIKTADDAPRDYRWPLLVAKLHTQFEDFPAAIAAYGRAITIRPDRADLHAAQAVLDERLLRFDEAVASYTKAYDLTYHDPQWMERIAEIRARQGQVDAAAKALRTALVEGRPERPEPFFAVAARLEEWQMLDAAKAAVDEGARLATPAKLLQDGRTYVSVNMRLRRDAATFDRLFELRREALAALTGDANREPIDNALSARLQQMGEIAAREYAPEEKRAFAAFLEQKRPSVAAADFAAMLVPLAEQAGFVELAVRWRVELMRANREPVNNDLRRLVQLQTERMRFLELAQQLEALAALRGPHTIEAGTSAADAYRKAGDTAGEFRMLTAMGTNALSDRYFQLLLERDPLRLIALAGPGPGGARLRDAVANFIVARGTVDQAIAAVRARGQGLPPVWTQAYTALVGLHFSRVDATTTDAFRSVLGVGPVGDRLVPVDRATRLAGDVWFEYGSRFGEYLMLAGQPGAGDYLPAAIERTPARSDAYVALADFHRDAGSGAEALAEYDHAASLNARRSDVHLRAAAILWRQGRRAAAVGRWRQGMEVLTSQAPRGTVDPALFVATLDSVASRKLLPELREPADAMVRAYITRNGAFRADGLLRAVFRAAGDAAAGTDWLLDLGRAAPNQTALLTAVARAPWLPDPQRDRVYERLVALGEEAVAREHGAAQAAAQAALDRWRVQRIQSLVDTRQMARADELVRALSEQTRASAVDDLTVIEVRVAAGLKTLNALLDRYARDDDQRVHAEALRNAATALRRSGDVVSARRVLEFVYTRQLDGEDLAATALLGLAEIRLEQGNVKAALDLLHRLTLVVGQPFEYLPAAGALLERLQHPAEALEFRRARVQAVPWDAEAQIALARTEIAAATVRDGALSRLTRVAESPAVRYGVRVEAARAFASAGGLLGRAPRSEIDLLRAPASLTPGAVDRPMFVDARIAAARRATDPPERVALLLAALAADPAHAGIRLPLFRAEIGMARPGDAIEAANPLVARSRSLNGLGLTAADRSRFARELGNAHQQVDRLPEAVRYLTVALDGEPLATRAALRQRIASINDEIARRARNESRRPRVAEALDQPQLVRPRIPPKVLAVAAAAPAPQGAGR